MKTQHDYYQWVPLALAFAACCFYLPRFVWKNVEEGYMASVCEDKKMEKDEDEEKANTARNLQ